MDNSCRARRGERLQLAQPARDFLAIFAAIERGNAKITFALRAKSATRCDNDV
jgi:hypothetical protein